MEQPQAAGGGVENEAATESVLLFRVAAREGRRATRVSAAVGWVLVVLAAVAVLATTLTQARTYSRDLANIFAGSLCLRQNCSPYDSATVQRLLEQRGYFEATPDKWAANLPLYPPFTLALLLPLSGLSFQGAAAVFYAMTLLLCGLALYQTFLAGRYLAGIAPWVRGLVVGLMVMAPDTRWALGNGNPVILASGLLLFACCDKEPSNRWLRAAAFAGAFLLKPQTAVFFLVPIFLARADGWRGLVRIGAILGPFVGATLAWCAAHSQLAGWRAGLSANLAAGAAHANTMSLTEHKYMADPRLNLSYLIGYWSADTRLDVALALAVLAVLGMALLWSAARLQPAQRQNQLLLFIAITAGLTLLPVYHRYYDAVVLYLALPWAMRSLAWRTHTMAAWATIFLVFAPTVTWVRHFPARLVGVEGMEQPSSFIGFLAHRLDAIFVLALTLLLVGTLLAEVRTGSAANPAS